MVGANLERINVSALVGEKLLNIFYIVNNVDFLISHRLELCKAAKNSGYEVHIVCPRNGSSCSLTDLGFTIHFINFSRNGSNPLSEILCFIKLFLLFKKHSPELVHLITIKPYLYGGIAARITRVRAVVSAVAGLGILFSSDKFKYRLLRLLLYPLFKIAFGHKKQAVIFQNNDDKDFLVKWGIVAGYKARIIKGSGVDLRLCSVLPEPENIPIVSFAGRLLVDKGVEVFVEASRLLRELGVNVNCWLIGEPDTGNPNSVTLEQLKRWQFEGVIEIFGYKKDVPYLFSKSNIVVFPSFYGEGLPKVLIEAAACARAVITTDHPGCRDAILPNETGLLVPVRDPVALAGAVQMLLKDSDLRQEMGRRGRILAEEVFSLEQIVNQHLEIYREVTSG